jgi:lipopolysaccharide assembly outer membrane protein LptD (OstA)
MFLIMVQCNLLISQVDKKLIDTTNVKTDTTVADTTLKKNLVSKDAILMPIIHTARGYRRTDLIHKKVYLVGEAEVKYGDIDLKADSIELNMETGLVFAIGRKDSTGKVIGSPDFKQGSESFKSKELFYNFKTKKGIIKNIFTEQEGGFLHSTLTKREDDGSLNINKSTFSTCDLEHPHFSINFTKAKVIPGKKIISGPAYLVLEDIPLPLALPFGFFPVQKKRSSGLIIPKYTQSQQLGYSLRDGGYYFVLNDYIDLGVTGSIYTNGTWMVNASSSYRRLYKYSGNFTFSYANNIAGHKGLEDYQKSTNYHIAWNYNQDAKAWPGSRFSASVNMSSSGYDRKNSYTVEEHVTTQRQSSISYSKTWEGTPFNISTSLNQSQNVSNKTISLNLPKVNFNVSRIYPLKGKNSTGPSKWYQELQFSYTAAIDNQLNTYDSLLFTSGVWEDMRNGFTHDIPVSLQIRPFRKISSFTISPQVMYSARLYTQKINKRWDPEYFNQDINKIVPSVVNDTSRGFFYGQAVNPSISAGLNPQIFGTYEFKNESSRIQKIRHIIRPSVTFSYTPVLPGLTTDMYREVQYDTAGHMQQYSIFEGNIFGTPSMSSRSGAVSFSLVNILEAKVFAKNDTTNKPKTVKLIDNFSINTSYNIFADSLRWAPVTMSYRSVLFNNLNLAATSNFSLYALDSKNRTINTFYYSRANKLLRLTGFTATLDFDLGKFFTKKEKVNELKSATGQPKSNPMDDALPGNASGANDAASDNKNIITDKFGYVKFDVPWSMRVAYNFYYTKTGTTSSVNQTISLVGDVSITKKTRVSYTTGFDIAKKEITMTSLGIYRDLHCWEMSVDWIPTGYLKSWSFTIRIKSSILADIKYDKRKDFRDN